MVVSNKIKERFCKDCNIPLRLFHEPYFTDRLKLYDKYYNTLSKWDLFVEELQKYNCEQDYFEEYNRVKDAAINDIKKSDGFQRFNEEDMNKYSVKHTNLPSKDIFKPSNDGKLFISIDMKKANFSVLKHYDSDIFGKAETWEEFIGKYTSNKHIINSKYIRQVILGNCNPKRQVTYEKYMMDTILTHIEKYNLNDKIVFFSNDEIVFDMTYSTDKVKLLLYMCKCLTEDIEEGLNILVRIELFTLYKINETNGYYKEIITKMEERNIEFKCLDSYMLPFVLRKFQNQEITESDKVFYHEGVLSKFIEVPEIEVNAFGH